MDLNPFPKTQQLWMDTTISQSKTCLRVLWWAGNEMHADTTQFSSQQMVPIIVMFSDAITTCK